MVVGVVGSTADGHFTHMTPNDVVLGTRSTLFPHIQVCNDTWNVPLS